MIEIVKEKIWELLSKKNVSLAMIYDVDGNILWHKGRKIIGRNVEDGGGFSKTYIKKALVDGDVLETGGLVVSCSGINATESVIILHIRSLIIHRISPRFYLYIDSGTKESFSPIDLEMFRFMGEILGAAIEQIKKNETEIGGIAGDSIGIGKIRERLITYSMVDEPVLLTGETGTGKTHIAGLIHYYSGRKGKFMIINTPGIPESLFESEMFGHAKGAFTDAKFEKKGLVEEAAGGTLFIDEITEVAYSMQAKLLRFIETGKYTRLGESMEREVDVRIVAASNKVLSTAIKDKEFREDLYYRLNVFEIELPPLRERKEDIKALVMEKKKHLLGKEIGEGFWEALHRHNWPGNVRELISVLKRAGVHNEDTITGNDVKNIINVGGNGSCPKSGDSDEVEKIWMKLRSGESFWDVVKNPFMARDLTRSDVKRIIAEGLEETKGKYKKLVNIFNLQKSDYHRLMRFLHEQELVTKE
ncbi:MAG: sigma-54-dependent Fis family transcriptional regulator [bacterium]|nr:sigma-54-dependent Fis family transcriptional regulator [bacterium]